MSRTSPDPFEDDMERHESMRDREYLDEQRADRAAERAPLPDFTPRTLGERHRENVAAIDRTLDRAEALADECEQRVDRLLPRREEGPLS